jgi:phosphate transport system substrate-binding protein
MRKLSAVLVASALVATVSFSGPAASAAESIIGKGAGYPALLVDECRSAYTGASVSYTNTGSGTGKSEFAKGATDFGASDSLYASGTAPSGFTYVPLVGGPIALAYNVAGVKKLNLTPALVSDIFLGNITQWNDAKIAKVNKGVKLPAQKIQTVYRSDTSGTTNNFTNYLSVVVGSPWKANDAFTTAAGKTYGIGGAKSTGVLSSIKTTAYSIGYLDLADSATSGLNTAFLLNGAGQYVQPTVRSSALFLAEQEMDSKGVVKFDYDASVKNAYNLSLVSYGLAPVGKGTAKAVAVKGFFNYVLKTCAPAKAAKLNYVSLTGKFQAQALKLAAKIG